MEVSWYRMVSGPPGEPLSYIRTKTSEAGSGPARGQGLARHARHGYDCVCVRTCPKTLMSLRVFSLKVPNCGAFARTADACGEQDPRDQRGEVTCDDQSSMRSARYSGLTQLHLQLRLSYVDSFQDLPSATHGSETHGSAGAHVLQVWCRSWGPF